MSGADGTPVKVQLDVRAARRRLCVAAATFGLTLSWPVSGQAQGVQAPSPPPELDSLLPGARLQGQTRLRRFGFHVYDARLWCLRTVHPGSFAGQPFGLELAYARRLSGAALADRSIEEMQRIEALPGARIPIWRDAMTEAFPDVEPGDRLTGVHLPDRGASFFHNGRPTRRIDEPDFSRRFFAIWLAPQVDNQELSRQLLGGHS